MTILWANELMRMFEEVVVRELRCISNPRKNPSNHWMTAKTLWNEVLGCRKAALS
jgi:hypothetical protein